MNCARSTDNLRGGGRVTQARPTGFTLIELLLVLTITGLLLALTPVLMQKAFPVLKLKAAARDMVQEMRFLQNAAVINGIKAEIRFDLEKGEYRSDLVNGGEVRALPAGLNLSMQADSLLASATPASRFVFYPDGSASGGLLYLGNQRQRLGIHVDWLTGKIQLNEAQDLP
jgi:general secretion pathway protein H